jgi:periplasmic protein TonB
MRVLLVDHDTAAVDKVARALRGVVELDCVSSKADALMLIKQKSYDVLIACERAADGSGLDLLGRIGKTGGDLQRIFSAAPERLQLLGTRLQPFNVTRTIGYPIDLEELWLALAAVTSGVDPSIEGTIEHVVMDESGLPPRAPQRQAPPAASAAPASAPPNKPAQSRPAMGVPPMGAPVPAAAVVQTVPPQPKPAVAVAASGGAARKLAPEAEPETVRRPTPSPAPAATPRAAAAAAPAPRQPAPTRAAASSNANASHADEVAFKVDALLASALAETNQTDAPPKKVAAKPLPLGLIGGAAAVVVLVGIAAALSMREPEQPKPVAETTPAVAPMQPAANSPSAATDDAMISALENRVEEALMRDDLAAASAAQAELAALSPTHPRLAFFAAALKRSAELQTLSQDQAVAPMAGTAVPARPAARSAGSVAATGPTESRTATVATPPEPRQTAAAATPSQAPADSRAANNRPNRSADTAKFRGRTLEETTSRSQRAGATASAPSAIEEIGPSPAPAAVPVATEPTPAKLVKRVSPEYPAEAASRGVEGSATVEFTVLRNGRVQDVRVVESTPRRTFDAAARDAVRRWQFEPAELNGQPVESVTRVRLEFKLKD